MKCKIQLDRDEATFYAGDYITGTVSLVAEKYNFIEAIDLIFHGQTDVQWYALNQPPSIIHNDWSSKELDEWQIKFNGSQEHFNYITRLSEDIELKTENEEYKFYYNIPLPYDLPCSSVQKYGSTIYKLKIQLKCQKLTSKIYEREICIRNHLDLRILKDLHRPFAIHEHSDDYEFWFDIPSTGYTPGQRIPCHTKLIGTGNKTIQIIIALNCFVKYQALRPFSHTKIEKKCLVLNVRNYYELTTTFIQIPLTTEISNQCYQQQQQQQQQQEQKKPQQSLMNFTYNMEILLINSTTKDILESYKVDLIIGTKPCYTYEGEETEDEIGFVNHGSSIEEVSIDETLL